MTATAGFNYGFGIRLDFESFFAKNTRKDERSGKDRYVGK
jgi:hypothetical protein